MNTGNNQMNDDEREEQTEDIEIDENESEIDKIKSQLLECEEKYRRALADYQNLEKRNISERAEWIKSANREMLLRILPIVDTLVLAKKHDDNKTLEVALNQFLDILKSEGVTKIETKNKKFDPTVMEVLEMVDDGDMVIEEVRSGYMLYDKLLRPAQVRVGKK